MTFTATRYDLYTLNLFLSVAAHQSIARSAEAENIAASAISKRLSDLESLVGTPLLYRHHRGVELTPAGEELYRYAQSIRRMVDHLNDKMSDYASGLRGTVRIAANTSAITQFLPEDLAEFVDDHPDIAIDLTEKTSEEIISNVKEGFADIGIYSGLIEETVLDTRTYRCDTLVVVAQQNHPIHVLNKVTLKDLAQHVMVGLQEGSSLQAFLDEMATASDIHLRTRIVVMSFDGVRRMVEAGLGIAVLPYGAVEPYLKSTKLIMLEIDEPWAKRELKIAVKDIQSITKSTRALAEHLISQKFE